METPSSSMFMFRFPVWLIAVRTCRVGDTDAPTVETNSMALIGVQVEGLECLPVFTDPDLAERFLLDNGLADGMILVAPSPPHLLAILHLQPDDVTHLCFDPGRVGQLIKTVATRAEVVALLKGKS